MPPSARLKKPGMPANGARETALLVTEQLARRELARQRAAIDGDELAGPPARAVDRLGDELFARARLAEDQHGARRAPHLFDLLVDGLHGRRFADQAAEVQVAAAVRARARRSVGVRLDGAQQLGAADRLRQIGNGRTAQVLDQRGNGRAAQILDERLDAGMAGDEYDALDGALTQLLEQLEAVAVGQHQVEQQDVGHHAAEQPARTLEALRALDGVAVQLQHFLRRRHKVRFVVYQQDVGHEYPDKDWMRSRSGCTGCAHRHSSLSAFYLFKIRATKIARCRRSTTCNASRCRSVK